MTHVDPARFREWAGGAPDRWRAIAGGELEHQQRGVGSVAKVDDWEGAGLHVYVRYPWPGDRDTLYSVSGFAREPWVDMVVPTDGLSPFLEWQKARGIIERRRMRFLGAEHPELLCLDWLDGVLLAIDEGSDLDKQDEVRLEREGLFGTLGDYLARRFERAGNGWDLVRACKNWRRDKKPEKAVKEDGKHSLGEARVDAALLTTIAAAFKDLGHLGEATARCTRALEIQKSHHPYNVLGGVSYRMGQFEQGDRWFEEARRLGGLPRDRDEEIRLAFAELSPRRREELVAHLAKGSPDELESLRRFLPETWSPVRRHPTGRRHLA